MSTVAGLVLAAGAGRRFGGPKALVMFDGERLVDRAVRLLHEGGCAPVYVVAGAAHLGGVHHAVVVTNPEWGSGMGSSLRAGLKAAVGAGAVVILPVDTPWIGAESVRRLIAARGDGATVAVATYGGKRGHPVLIGSTHWAAAAAAAVGDTGARAFLAAHPDLVTEVPCDGTGRPDDVDTPDALPSA